MTQPNRFPESQYEPASPDEELRAYVRSLKVEDLEMSTADQLGNANLLAKVNWPFAMALEAKARALPEDMSPEDLLKMGVLISIGMRLNDTMARMTGDLDQHDNLVVGDIVKDTAQDVYPEAA